MEQIFDLNSFLNYVKLHLHNYDVQERKSSEDLFTEIQFVLSWSVFKEKRFVEKRKAFLRELFDLLTDFDSILNVNKNGNRILKRSLEILKIIRNNEEDASLQYSLNAMLAKRITDYLSVTVFDKISIDFGDHKSISSCEIRIFERLLLIDTTFEFSFVTSNADVISQEIVSLLSIALSIDNSKLCGNLCSNVLAKYLRSDKILIRDKDRLLISVFRTLYDCVDDLSGKEESVCLSIYSILVSLNEESSDLSIDQNSEMLEILQTIIERCLASAHNFVRKLARELLKIVILLLNFDAGKRQIFLDYITFLDVLEEKQVHLIKPALIQLDSILKQAGNANSSLRNSFTFDISWALIIFRNGFTHLNGYVAKAMVVKYFQQSPYRCPGLVGQKSQLLLDFALPALKDGDFYQRCIDDNVLESFLDSLKTFLSEVIQISNEHANLFFDFILSIFQSKNWGPVPLMFLCHVLMSLPDLPEIWNETNFDQLRCSFYALLQGSSPYFRAAIQECLFHLSFRLIDWSVTSPWKFAPNVFPFVSEDLYKYGSKYFSLARYLWKDVKEEISFENDSFVTNDLNDNNRKSIVAVSLIRSDRKVMDEIIAKINNLLDNVSQRPYVDQNKVIAHLQILADMLSLYPSELLTSVVTKLNIGNVLQFIISLNNENFKIDFLTLWQSSVLLISSLSERKLSEWKSDFDHFKNNLVEQCLSDSTTIVRTCFCLKLLNACNGNLSTEQTEKLFQSLVSISDKISTDVLIPNKTDSQIFVAQYRSIQWKVIGRLLLNCKKLATIEICSFTEIIFDMFDHADDETIHEILNCLDLLIKKIPVISTDLLLKIIDRSKRVIFDMSKSDMFISSLKFLISIMLVGYCKITNGKTENETYLLTLIKKILNDLHDEGAQNNSICYQVAKQFYICITNNLDYQEILIKTFHEILVKFCLFGNVIRRDQNEHLAAQKCRIFALLLIEQYFEAHGDDVESLAQLLQTTMNATLESPDGKIRTKYYALSYCHRVRTRALQLFVLLQPFIAEKRLANDLITFCKDLLTVEGQLGSIRLLLEILVVRLVLVFPSPFLDDWLNSVNEMGTKRIGSLCSWVQVVMHVLLSLVNELNSVSLCERCINSILPLCTAQNFTVRCCAQSVLKRIWIEYEYKFVDDDRLISFKHLIDNCVNFTMENRNATKNVEKTLSDFYFSIFDMQKHYTLEAIFQLLPEKCHLPIDEWLELDLMKKCVGNTIDHLKFMSSRYVDENLQKAKSIIWTGTSQTISEGDEFVSTRFDALQTKAFIELDTSLRSSAGLQEKDKPPSNQQCQLIVVASLIDRPTNLGGLCRTCEVFGATEFVIGSLKFVEDSQFQSLSVSSERWMNITEVSETCLTAGIHSIGFVILPFAHFPLRIFRNEKEGIPPVLIQHLDQCVVIPQVGVIRSMNVHVAGAMLIWEYAKQHRLK